MIPSVKSPTYPRRIVSCVLVIYWLVIGSSFQAACFQKSHEILCRLGQFLKGSSFYIISPLISCRQPLSSTRGSLGHLLCLLPSVTKGDWESRWTSRNLLAPFWPHAGTIAHCVSKPGHWRLLLRKKLRVSCQYLLTSCGPGLSYPFFCLWVVSGNRWAEALDSFIKFFYLPAVWPWSLKSFKKAEKNYLRKSSGSEKNTKNSSANGDPNDTTFFQAGHEDWIIFSIKHKIQCLNGVSSVLW